MLEVREYESVMERPEGVPVVLQNWRDLLFLHFSIDPLELLRLIPSELSLDTFPDEQGRERAWIGLVPFRIEGFRAPWMPPLPGISNFPETNVRTYVHYRGQEPGVWFFSLDAGKWLAALAGKLTYRMPYFHAEMSACREGWQLEFDSDRQEGPPARSRIKALAAGDTGNAEPGSLEYFLIERRVLYAAFAGELYSARVHHARYRIGDAQLLRCTETLVKAGKLPERDWEHLCFSPGVDVEAFPLKRVSERVPAAARAAGAEMF